MNFAVRVLFADDETAIRRWAPVGRRLIESASSVARKRDGASHVVLFRGVSDSEAERIVESLGEQSGVVTVTTLTEAEFWSAPSNAV